jgi:transposase
MSDVVRLCMISTEQLPTDTEALQKIIFDLSLVVNTKDLRIQQLEEMLRQLRGERFGSSSEKISEDQLRLFNAEEKDCILPEDTKEEKIESYTRKKPGRRPLPENMETIRVEHDLKPEEKQCPCGCGEMSRIGEEITEQVNYIPAKFQLIENVRFKYACKKCAEGVYTAPLPPQLIPKSIVTPDFMAHVVVSKFQDGMPLYRQVNIFSRIGFDITRATLSNWVINIGEKVQPVVNLIRDHLLECQYIGMDETPIQVLKEENRAPQTQSYIWVIREGPPGKGAVLYYYDPHRSQKVLKEIIEGFKGYLQSDGYQAYINMDAYPGITVVGCFAHARRYFVKVIKAGNKKTVSGTAAAGVNFIRKLYAIEEKLKERSPEERYNVRQIEAKHILEEMKAWLDDVIVRIPPKTLTGTALHYLNKNWKYLIRYIDDGRLEIDNNKTENAIRPFVVGRKNWLFCDTPEGANATANFYTLIETARNNGWEPYEYLRIMFNILPYCKTLEQFEFILPWNLPGKNETRDKIPV